MNSAYPSAGHNDDYAELHIIRIVEVEGELGGFGAHG